MPKKITAQDSRNQHSSPMSPPYTHTLNQATGVQSNPPLGDDDDDDICPVCESECTCHNRGNPSSASRITAPMRTSTFSSTNSSPPKTSQLQTQTLQPLKIKLTVPPSLKFRKSLAASGSSSNTRHLPTQTYASNRSEPGSSPATIRQQSAPGILDSLPKRRGRPPKAVVAAREAAKAALASSHAVYGTDGSRSATRKGTHVTVSKSTISKAKAKSQTFTPKGRVFTKPAKKNGKRSLPAPSTSSHMYSSDEEPHYPTFMPAASSSSLTSSSESSSINSSESSDSSDSEHDDISYPLVSERDKTRLRTNGDSLQKRRDHPSGNRWEIKPRKQSVDPEEIGMDADSEDATSSEDGADDEEDSDDEDECDDDDDDEGAAEADVEEDGLAAAEEHDLDEGDGKLGVSFGGLPTGWSEDEESSFDADLFFANLDDSSDSCASPVAMHLDSFGSGLVADSDRSFSGDEEDALLLMDIDPSVQIRRSNDEFEFDLELDGLILGPDGQLLLPANFGHFAAFEGGVDFNATDVDMAISQGGSSTEDEAGDLFGADATGVILEESDGETTEDELVDSNGLPNQKAMALFRWPTPISTVDPLSTVSQSAAVDGQDSPPTSNTLRHALAAMSTDHHVQLTDCSMSTDELEELDHPGDGLPLSHETGRAPGFPTMGQFAASAVTLDTPHAVIDGTGAPIPSPFPRSRILRTRKLKERSKGSLSRINLTTDLGAARLDSATPFVSVYPPSSDEFGSQSHAQTSDDPSSTDAIDLDDVLDVTFLDSEPNLFDSDTPQTWLTPSTPTASAPSESLSRWDRIPVGTFRRTRETSMLERTPGSDSGLASLYPAISALLNNDMLGTPKSKGKKLSAKKQSKSGASSTLVVSPVLLPVRDRDGDRTPTGNEHPLYDTFSQTGPAHQQKSRKELRKEKAMMKRKMIGKYANPSPRNPQHAHRHHYPNAKTRGTGSIQRISSNVPHLNL